MATKAKSAAVPNRQQRRKTAATKKNSTPQKTPAETGSQPNQLLQNFDMVHKAIADNQINCVVGVAVLRNGVMIDMFGTAGELLGECAALVQLQNLGDNMRGMQQRRIQAQQQAARDAQAKITPPGVNAGKPPKKAAQT